MWSSIFCFGLYWLYWFCGDKDGWFDVNSFIFVGLGFDLLRFLDGMVGFVVEFFGLRIDESWLFRCMEVGSFKLSDLFLFDSFVDEFMDIWNLLVFVVGWLVLFEFDVVILLVKEFVLLLLLFWWLVFWIYLCSFFKIFWFCEFSVLLELFLWKFWLGK